MVKKDNMDIMIMAVAAISEDSNIPADKIIVHRFREVPPSHLERYLADNMISYKKYTLEGIVHE